MCEVCACVCVRVYQAVTLSVSECFLKSLQHDARGMNCASLIENLWNQSALKAHVAVGWPAARSHRRQVHSHGPFANPSKHPTKPLTSAFHGSCGSKRQSANLKHTDSNQCFHWLWNAGKFNLPAQPDHIAESSSACRQRARNQ